MRLINEEGKSIGCSIVTPGRIRDLSGERLEILKLLSVKPYYPAQLAREMGMQLQTIYYHIRILERAGFIEFMDYEEHGGGIAKRYAAKVQSIAVVVNNNAWKKSAAPAKEIPEVLRPFVGQGFFDGLIVVGSPEPHGKYRARGSEFAIVEIAMLLGSYCHPTFPIYSLDTQIKAEERKKNLILAGGPKVNTLVAEINGALPIRYFHDFSEIYSTVSTKSYSGNIGVVELISNPDAEGKEILMVGGLNQHGTRAAVLALMENKVKGNTVVEGFDEDGDGRVDSIEVLESD